MLLNSILIGFIENTQHRLANQFAHAVAQLFCAKGVHRHDCAGPIHDGLSAEQMSGSGWQNTVHPEDLDRHMEKWRQSLATGEALENEVRFRGAADGHYRWFLARSVPVRDEQGNISKWYGIATDIEDRKRAEEALRRSVRELRDLIETMPSLAFSTWPDGSGEFTSGRWREYSGLSPEETFGERGASTIYPDDRDLHLGKWRASLASGEPFENEARHRSAKGEYRWFLVRAVPLCDEHGRVLKWYGSLTDINDRKQAEALLTGEKRILEMVAKGDSLPQILDGLCRLAEEQASDVLASILLLEGDRLRHGGAPSLPKAYTDAIDGVVIGPFVGSCGTAAYRAEQVIVEDIATDPLWADYREAALPHSLRACWSTPIFSAQGKVMATFAMYYREPRSPSPRDQEIIEQITHLAGVAIERKLTQQALRQSEAYLAEAQRLSHIGNWAHDVRSDRTIYWSEEMFRIHDFDPKDGLPDRQTVLQRFHPEDLKVFCERYDSAVRNREKDDIVLDTRLVMPDGSLKYIHGIGHPVLNEAGEIIEFRGTVADVTEQKKNEEALRRSEAYLAEAQKLSKTGSWAWSPGTGEVRYWSEECYRVLGFDPAEPAPRYETFVQRIHADDQGMSMEGFEKATREKADFEMDYRIVHPGGHSRDIHVVGHPTLDASGDLIEFVGTVIDVTERKRAEETLRRSEAYLAEAQRLTRTGSWAWDPIADKLLYWSDEMFRIFGFDPQEGIPSGPEFGQRVHPEDHDRVLEHVRNSVTEKRDYVVTHRIVLPDGTVKHIETIGHPVLNSSGEAVEYVGTAVDITERKLAEEERERLRQLETDLARMNRVSMMGELAASLAHEVKQPIAAAATNAKTSLRWLQREPPDIGEAREAVSRIVKDVLRAADIIDRNRALYRRDKPKQEMVNLNEVVREMIALLHDVASRQSISIRAELDGALPAITADRVQIQQVLMNLMLNGIEAMKGTGGELTISSKKNKDGQVVLSVSDLGVGLPAEKIDQIFDAFFTTKTQGTGMGLSISRRIVESHGRRLWASGNSGRGATFHFTVPTEAKAFQTTLERTGS
jgi:PAS domain S-box-containing protein